MSTIKVKGKAQQDFEADIFSISFKIIAEQPSSGDAIESGKKHTELFLQTMKRELGLNPDDFIMEDFSVRKGYYNSNGYSYSKKMKIIISANLQAVEKIAVLMEQMSNIECSMELDISDVSEKEQLVLQSAINDSRKKAELIAVSLGKKITGIEEAYYETYSQEIGERERGICTSLTVDFKDDLASQIKNPVKTIEKAIDIIWIME